MTNPERGDTLVEVLIAIAVLSTAIVGGLGIMNFGYGIANNAVERTQVQASMNSQLSMISYARDAYIQAEQQPSSGGARAWQAIMSHVTNGAPNTSVCNGVTPQPSGGFYIKEDIATFDTASVTAYNGTAATTLALPGSGMWIEGRKAGGAVNYVDFYVKSCWSAVGAGSDQMSRTVMRLYVPQ